MKLEQQIVFNEKKQGEYIMRASKTILSILLAVTGVMHEADDAYSIWSTWSCYWLDQFLTLALDAWILSKFSTLYWICLLLVFSHFSGC